MGIEVPTLLEALRADPAGYDVTLRAGLPGARRRRRRASPPPRGRRRARTSASRCSATRPGCSARGTSGEGCDAADLRLPGRRRSCSRRVLATGTPVVLVLLVGRPYELSRQVDRLAAIVCGFFPGEEGGPALADVLSGRVEPGGRLPVSFPAAGGEPAVDLPRPRRSAGAATSARSTPPRCSRSATACRTRRSRGSDVVSRSRGRVADGRQRRARGDAAQRHAGRRVRGRPGLPVTTPSPRSPGRCSRWSRRSASTWRPARRGRSTFTLHADATAYSGRAASARSTPARSSCASARRAGTSA